MLFSNLLKVVLITIIIFSMLFFSFVKNVESADALVIDGSIITIVGAILIGAGMIFNNDDDLSAAASNFYNSLDAADAAYIADKAGEFSQAAIGGGNFLFKCTQGILTSLGDWIVSKFTVDSAGAPALSVPGTIIISGIDYSWAPLYEIESGESYSNFRKDYSNFFPVDLFPIPLKNHLGKNSWFVLSEDKTCFYKSTNEFLSGADLSHPYDSLFLLKEGSFYYTIRLAQVGSISYNYYYTLAASGYPATVDVFVPGLVSGVDVTYFPQEVVSSGAGTTEFPVNTASDALTTDMPLTIPADGVSSTTGATDVRAPGATVPDVPATGFWETLWQWLQSIVDGIAGIPAAIAAGITGLIDFVKTLFDPTGFSLDFSPLKVGLTSVFPFCIPFDFFRAVEVFAAESSSFTFDIDLETKYFEVDHTVDLSPFALPIAFFRYVVVFWFGFILISRTRDFMKW